METRTCRACHKAFSLDERDLAFYAKMEVPPPTHCPDCRLQRRLSFRNERVLSFRTCGLTGKRMLSVFKPESPYKVFAQEAWYGDGWNALDYGRPLDFSRPFFEQFGELMREVPLLAVNVMGVQNCDYVNQCGWSKNSYLIIEADYDEDCMFGHRIFYSKTCLESTEVFRCERCYESTDCENCFRLFYSQLCRQCSESAFLYDCRGCTNCFGCVGLRQKTNCWFNEQLSKEDYATRRAAFDFQNPDHMAETQKRFLALKMSFPHKSMIGEMNENVSGNYIYESKDCADCFEIRACRDCRYCHLLRNTKDCMDYFVWGDGGERIYESECCGHNVNNLRFCCECFDGVHDLTYCYQCMIGTCDCFGCIGIKKGRYCILNKQYAKEEYEALVPKIIEHMKKMREFGEFFPMAIAPYGYNETVAHEYFPMEKEAAEERGLAWHGIMPITSGKETLTWDKIPHEISKVPDTITNEILACSVTGRNFRITAQELKFYRDMRLPLPRVHPDERHRRRALLRNPKQLWLRACQICSAEIQTTYAPERLEKVVCEKCYLACIY